MSSDQPLVNFAVMLSEVSYTADGHGRIDVTIIVAESGTTTHSGVIANK